MTRWASLRGFALLCGLVLVQCGGKSVSGSVKPSSDAGDGGAGGSLGSPCDDKICTATEFCDYKYDWCTAKPPDALYASVTECAPRTAPCPPDLPACGCDGNVYPDACAAYAAGVDIGGNSAGQEQCAHALTPPGRFACGPWFCDPNVSYCRYSFGDTGDRTVECRVLPAECGGVASCDCVPPPYMGFGKCLLVEGMGVTGVLVTESLL